MFKVQLKEGEFALSKDVDVQLWLDRKAYQQLPPVAEVHRGCFVVMNEESMTDFESFKEQISDSSGSPTK